MGESMMVSCLHSSWHSHNILLGPLQWCNLAADPVESFLYNPILFWWIMYFLMVLTKHIHVINVKCTINLHQSSIWVNYSISLTWIKAIWGWFPLLTMIPVRSQWGRHNLPRSIKKTSLDSSIHVLDHFQGMRIIHLDAFRRPRERWRSSPKIIASYKVVPHS